MVVFVKFKLENRKVDMAQDTIEFNQNTVSDEYIVLDEDENLIAMGTTVDECKELIEDAIYLWHSTSSKYTIYKTIECMSRTE